MVIGISNTSIITYKIIRPNPTKAVRLSPTKIGSMIILLKKTELPNDINFKLKELHRQSF